MKKIHPSSPPISDRFSLLPAAIITLAVALSPEDKQVLEYLVSSSGNNFSGHHKAKPETKASGAGDHSPEFGCSCFECYMSYWARWNNSPNREIIHEIIDAYEEALLKKKGKSNGIIKNKKARKRANYKSSPGETEKKGVLKESSKGAELTTEGEVMMMGNLEKESPVKKIVSFLGGRIWGVWGI